jgi:hypothetical protein
VYEFGWADGVDQRVAVGGGWHRLETDTGEAMALSGHTLHQLEAMLTMVDGSLHPICVIPRIDSGDADDWATEAYRYRLRRHQLFYGRVVNAVRVETVLGEEDDPNDAEVARAANITIRSED